MIKNFNIKVLIIVFFLISGVSFSLENKIVLKVENNIITTLDIFNEIALNLSENDPKIKDKLSELEEIISKLKSDL